MNNNTLAATYVNGHFFTLYWENRVWSWWACWLCLSHLVSKAVDEGVQHGDQDCIKTSGHFHKKLWVLGVGNTVEKENNPMKDADGSQMGRTSREGLLESTLRRHLDDSDYNKDIGGQDDEKAVSLIEYRNDYTWHLTQSGVWAGYREYGWEFTGEVIDDAIFTVW